MQIGIWNVENRLMSAEHEEILAQTQYFGFLAKANKACPNMNIVIVAGNHDAGSRLEAPKGLLDSLHISVIATSVLTPERSKNRESESSKPILWGSERNAMVAFAVRKFSREPENCPIGTDDCKIPRNTKQKRRKPGRVARGLLC